MKSDLCFGNLFLRQAVDVLVLVLVAAGYLAACGGGSGASNTAPVANAGPDQNVMTGTIVTLDGSASTDPNDDLLDHGWLLMFKPTGSAATLSSTTAVRPTFTADRDGAYVARLVVNDGHEDSQADTVTITAFSSNIPPVANAGPDNNVTTGSAVTLDGSGSKDADGDPLAYRWSFLSKPATSMVSLSNPEKVSPYFTADRDGVYVASLVVNDGHEDSQADTVTITAFSSNVPPVANAGPDQNVKIGKIVSLDGRASTDADGDSLTYRWSFTSRPAESAAVLSSVTSAQPTFMPDRENTYIVSLIVNDGEIDSVADTVTITALAPAGIWGPAVTIDSGTGDAMWPNLAMDASGTAVVVWIQENGVRSSRYVPGTGWDAATPISAGTVRADTPLVAMDGSGNAMAVWRQGEGTDSSIYANRYLPGTGWSAATPISAGTVRADTPHVAMDGNGNAIAIWRQWDGTDSNIYAKRYVPGAGWGVETLIETGVDEADQPKVSINRNGTAITVWRYWKGSTSNSQWSASVYANRYEPGTGWGIETRIDAALGNATNPVAAIDSAGNILTVWNQTNADIPPRQSIATRRYESRTGWGGVTNLAEVGYGGFVGVKEVTTGDMGFAVVWTQGTAADAYGMSLPSTMEFEVSIYVPGTGWTSPANLGTAGWITDSANVAMGHDGNGVAVWSRQDLHLEGDIVNSSYTIYANRYVSGAGWGAPSVVATADGEVSPPQVGTDGNGNFTIVWGQRSGGKSTIFAVRYQQP